MKKMYRSGLFLFASIVTSLLMLPAAQAVDFAISGHINRAVLWADNGNDNDTFFVDNENSNSRWRFTGSNDFDKGWTVGITREVEMESNSSDDFDIGENDDTTDVNFTERKLEFYVQHKTFGKLYLGQGSTASDGTSEVDLSGTDVVASSDIPDMAGGASTSEPVMMPKSPQSAAYIPIMTDSAAGTASATIPPSSDRFIFQHPT